MSLRARCGGGGGRPEASGGGAAAAIARLRWQRRLGQGQGRGPSHRHCASATCLASLRARARAAARRGARVWVGHTRAPVAPKCCCCCWRRILPRCSFLRFARAPQIMIFSNMRVYVYVGRIPQNAQPCYVLIERSCHRYSCCLSYPILTYPIMLQHIQNARTHCRRQTAPHTPTRAPLRRQRRLGPSAHEAKRPQPLRRRPGAAHKCSPCGCFSCHIQQFVFRLLAG